MDSAKCWLHLYKYKYVNTSTAVNKHSNVHGIFDNMKTYSDGGKANNESHNIRQHVERICYQSDGVCDVTDDDFHEEEAGCHWQHGQQATWFPGVAGHDGDLSQPILQCPTPHNGYILDPTMSHSSQWISSRSYNVPLLTMDIFSILQCPTPHNGYLLDPTMSHSSQWISSRTSSQWISPRSYNVQLLKMDIFPILQCSPSYNGYPLMVDFYTPTPWNSQYVYVKSSTTLENVTILIWWDLDTNTNKKKNLHMAR